jgi:hypothetical protein
MLIFLPSDCGCQLNQTTCDCIVIERRFPDGRLVEVLDLGSTALVRVHAPGGGVYIEVTYENLGEAIAAITVWKGDGYPLGKQQQKPC